MKLMDNILRHEDYLVLSAIPLFWIILLLVSPHNLGYWTQYWWMFPIALAIAVTVNTVGISGAALFVPFFILIFPLLAVPLAPEQSIKLGLITESFGLSSSALAFLRYGLVDKKLGFSIVIKVIAFVIGGAFLSFYLPRFAVLLLVSSSLLLSVYLLVNSERKRSKLECIQKDIIGKHHKIHKDNNDNVTLIAKDGKKYKYCRVCGRKGRSWGYSFGGILQGLTGFGIGEMGIISMVVSKIPIRVAIGTNHIIVALTAIAGSITHVAASLYSNTSTPWNIVFMTVPAVVIGGQIAPYVAARFKSATLEHFVAGLFVLLSMSLLYIAVKSFGL